MTPVQVIFLVTSLVLLVSALMVVTTRNLVRAALWLVSTLFFTGVVFVLLEAGFLAVVQIVIYIGAIAILFIFAVMLTRRVMKDSGPQTNSNWWLAGIFSLLFMAGVISVIVTWSGSERLPADLPLDLDTVNLLGQQLVSPSAYVLPFEVASVLLLAALIGAIVVAWDQ